SVSKAMREPGYDRETLHNLFAEAHGPFKRDTLANTQTDGEGEGEGESGVLLSKQHLDTFFDSVSEVVQLTSVFMTFKDVDLDLKMESHESLFQSVCDTLDLDTDTRQQLYESECMSLLAYQSMAVLCKCMEADNVKEVYDRYESLASEYGVEYRFQFFSVFGDFLAVLTHHIIKGSIMPLLMKSRSPSSVALMLTLKGTEEFVRVWEEHVASAVAKDSSRRMLSKKAPIAVTVEGEGEGEGEALEAMREMEAEEERQRLAGLCAEAFEDIARPFWKRFNSTVMSESAKCRR
ncbi:hypothetical protein KIPB_007516, partial [Kipferlia bialata]